MRFPGSDTLTAALAMRADLPRRLFGATELERIHAVADLDEDLTIGDFQQADPRLLAAVDVLITGWGCPRIGAAELAAMPRLRAVVHAAGTVKDHVSPDVWSRGIIVTTAADANAHPVAEYTLAAILLAGKECPSWPAATRPTRLLRGEQDRHRQLPADRGHRRRFQGRPPGGRTARVLRLHRAAL